MSMTRPPYPSAFREQMVELVRSGRSPEELAREFEPSAQSIRNWVGQADRDEGRSHEGLTVDRRAILTPQYQATSIAYRADRRATQRAEQQPPPRFSPPPGHDRRGHPYHTRCARARRVPVPALRGRPRPIRSRYLLVRGLRRCAAPQAEVARPTTYHGQLSRHVRRETSPVGKLLGHRRHRSTAGYAHVVDGHLAETAERISRLITDAMDGVSSAQRR